ncbi:MAG: hypothetical protein AAF514_24715, partial [Verrucomicrobiota bacterium]
GAGLVGFDATTTRLGTTVLRSQFQFEGAEAAYFKVRGTRSDGYSVRLGLDGSLQLIRVENGIPTMVKEGEVAFSPPDVAINVLFTARDRSLAFTAWQAGSEQPGTPDLSADECAPPFGEGHPGIQVLNGQIRLRSVRVEGQVWAPELVDLRLLSKDLVFDLEILTEPGCEYNLEASPDRITYSPTAFRFYGREDSTTTRVSMPASLGSVENQTNQFFRAMDVATDRPVEIVGFVPQRTTRPRLLLEFQSLPDRPYRFEYSDDLMSWKPFENIIYRGDLQNCRTQAALAMPGNPTQLFVRVLTASDPDCPPENP